MTPERRLRAKDIFQAVVGLPSPEREGYLDQACEGDPGLRAGVEGLLAQEQRADTTDYVRAREQPPWATDGGIRHRLNDFDDYRNIEYVGHGGMGVVYRAFDARLEMQVALKLPLPELPEEVVRHFIREPQNIVRLRHPHIVHVHKAGERDGRPFFTMNLIEGPNLDQHLGPHPRDPRPVAALMVKVARAIHHAHQRGILHRDLKPGNILLDRDGEPLVTDFGLATDAVPVGAATAQASAGVTTGSRTFEGILGTVQYMSPEQAEPSKEVTTLSDVYGLGAVLYALLTGRPPFQDDDLSQLLERVRDPQANPERPNVLNPRVDRDLQAICLRCLHKEPARRYVSAEDLARALQRWLDATSDVHKRRKARAEEETLRNNAFAAYGIASTVLWQLEAWSKLVVDTARDPNLRKLLKAADRPRLQQYFEHPSNRALPVGEQSPFASCVVLDKKGKLLAIAPMKSKVVNQVFDGRDYFRGAMRHAQAGRTGLESVHVSRVYRRHDRRFEFALSVPVRAADGPTATVVGVLVVSLTTDSRMGLVRLGDERRTAVLIGRGDSRPPRPGAEPGAPEGYLVVVHPVNQREAAAVVVRSPRIAEVVRLRPAPEFQLQNLEPFDLETAKEASRLLRYTVIEPGRASHQTRFADKHQLAGFAQVGNTELVVIVQQPYDQAVEAHT